jgi:hypothetical protein
VVREGLDSSAEDVALPVKVSYELWRLEGGWVSERDIILGVFGRFIHSRCHDWRVFRDACSRAQEMEDSGVIGGFMTASFASLSTRSLPATPLWPGTHTTLTWDLVTDER